jgi:RNA polymerase sigma-70 factor (ECF subfamily)
MTSIENQHGSIQERGYAGVLTGREPSEQQGLHDTIAKLRAFSVLLCMDVDLADDLVAVTLTRASVAMSPSRLGENLASWLFSRLRSYYYREYAIRSEAASRRGKLLQPEHFASSQHHDILAGLAKLAPEQREALVLTEAAGFSFTEAARICRRPPGRFKDLVETAEANLARLLGDAGFRPLKQTTISLALLAQLRA